MRSMKHLNLQVKLSLSSKKSPDNGTFGKGVATLLRGVEQYGSLNAAAKSIRMAYSKAWRIIKETEAGFGFALIDRNGARGSKLTAEGNKILLVYEELEKDGDKYLTARLEELLTAK